jgi:peroxiredoxin
MSKQKIFLHYTKIKFIVISLPAYFKICFTMKNIIWIIITICTLQACTEHKGYIIRGKLSDANGMTITLMKVTADSVFRIDSCVIKKGKFEMKGIVEYPEYCGLYAGDYGPLLMFVENAEINIELDLDDMQYSKVTGSKENDLFVQFNSNLAEFEERYIKVIDEYMAMSASGETDDAKVEGYVAQTDTIKLQYMEFIKQFADENKNSIVTAIIVNNYMSDSLTPEELEQYANGFDELNSQSSWVQTIFEKIGIARRIETGQPFVDFTMLSPEGKVISLSDYAGKGKYVMIDFWASWCQPCRNANPDIVKLYKKYKDKGFEIVGVSLDKEKSEWTKAIRADSLKWPQMSDLKYWESEAARLYAVYSIPHAVLLDNDGTILARELTLDELKKKLEELFKN